MNNMEKARCWLSTSICPPPHLHLDLPRCECAATFSWPYLFSVIELAWSHGPQWTLPPLIYYLSIRYFVVAMRKVTKTSHFFQLWHKWQQQQYQSPSNDFLQLSIRASGGRKWSLTLTNNTNSKLLSYPGFLGSFPQVPCYAKSFKQKNFYPSVT